jgi:hypothetical protein
VGTRAIVRREEPHSGAQFNLFDPDGWRHQVFITNTTYTDITYLEARHRGHARVEDRIRCAKDTGLRNLPFGDFANNACWVELICLAQDLIAFTQGLVLDGDMASAEPKCLRYALFAHGGAADHDVSQDDPASTARMAVGQCAGRCLCHTSLLATDHLNNVSLAKSNQHQLRDPSRTPIGRPGHF